MSPKNKGTFGRGKPPITDPDDFITGVQTTAERLKPYVPHIVLASVVILLVAIGAAVYSWIGDRRAEAATTAFAEVVEVSSQRAGMPTFSGEGEIGPAAFESAAEQAEAVLERIEHLRDEHGSARISDRVRLLEGKALRDLGRYDEAREAYRAVAESGAPEMLRVVAREGIGYSYEEEALAAESADDRQQGLERALEMFEVMQPDEAGPMRAYALYHQGRVLDALGRIDEAIERLEQGQAAAAGSGARADIADRLALLDAAPSAARDEVEDPAGEAEPDDGAAVEPSPAPPASDGDGAEPDDGAAVEPSPAPPASDGDGAEPDEP